MRRWAERRGGWPVHKTAETLETVKLERAELERAWLRGALHDLCQPLTALECRLYLGRMGVDGTPSEKIAELRVSMDEALRQCERMMTKVRAMQDHLNEQQ